MPTVLYNPGECVFDPITGEPYIDEEGNLVQVEPGIKVPTPDGRTLDGDDVANAAWYRANKFQGETLRDVSIGVPYERLVLGTSDASEAITLVVAEIRTQTPGVIGVVGSQLLDYNNTTRVLQWTATVIRADGDIQNLETQTNG
jgi:hypothetical protein